MTLHRVSLLCFDRHPRNRGELIRVPFKEFRNTLDVGERTFPHNTCIKRKCVVFFNDEKTKLILAVGPVFIRVSDTMRDAWFYNHFQIVDVAKAHVDEKEYDLSGGGELTFWRRERRGAKRWEADFDNYSAQYERFIPRTLEFRSLIAQKLRMPVRFLWEDKVHA